MFIEFPEDHKAGDKNDHTTKSLYRFNHTEVFMFCLSSVFLKTQGRTYFRLALKNEWIRNSGAIIPGRE